MQLSKRAAREVFEKFVNHHSHYDYGCTYQQIPAFKLHPDRGCNILTLQCLDDMNIGLIAYVPAVLGCSGFCHGIYPCKFSLNNMPRIRRTADLFAIGWGIVCCDVAAIVGEMSARAINDCWSDNTQLLIKVNICAIMISQLLEKKTVLNKSITIIRKKDSFLLRYHNY